MLDRDGLLELADRTLRDIQAYPPAPHDAKRFTVRMTSGTTGRAPVVILNEHTSGDARGFDSCSCLLICMGGNNTRLANMLLVSNQAKESLHILAIDEADVFDDIAPLLQDLQPDCFRGFTSFVRRVAVYLPDSARVRKLKLSGEKWTPTLRDEFIESFPNALFEILYITNEIGVIATRLCEHLLPNHFHPVPGVVVEIGSPDETGLGDVLITKVFYRTFEAVRYQVGDVGRMQKSVCGCGQISFELIGRKGADYLKVAGAVLLREEFDRVATLCHDLFEEYRAEAGVVTLNGIPRGELVLSVFRSDGVWSDVLEAEICNRFSRELFLTQTRTLQMLVDADHFLPLKVRRAIEPFPRKNKEVTLSLRTETI